MNNWFWKIGIWKILTSRFWEAYRSVSVSSRIQRTLSRYLFVLSGARPYISVVFNAKCVVRVWVCKKQILDNFRRICRIFFYFQLKIKHHWTYWKFATAVRTHRREKYTNGLALKQHLIKNEREIEKMLARRYGRGVCRRDADRGKSEEYIHIHMHIYIIYFHRYGGDVYIDAWAWPVPGVRANGAREAYPGIQSRSGAVHQRKL